MLTISRGVFLAAVVDAVRLRAVAEAVLLVDARPPRVGLEALERPVVVEVFFLGGMTRTWWGRKIQK